MLTPIVLGLTSKVLSQMLGKTFLHECKLNEVELSSFYSHTHLMKDLTSRSTSVEMIGRRFLTSYTSNYYNTKVYMLVCNFYIVLPATRQILPLRMCLQWFKYICLLYY